MQLLVSYYVQKQWQFDAVCKIEKNSEKNVFMGIW